VRRRDGIVKPELEELVDGGEIRHRNLRVRRVVAEAGLGVARRGISARRLAAAVEVRPAADVIKLFFFVTDNTKYA
jgi:hypothetical protein